MNFFCQKSVITQKMHLKKREMGLSKYSYCENCIESECGIGGRIPSVFILKAEHDAGRMGNECKPMLEDKQTGEQQA